MSEEVLNVIGVVEPKGTLTRDSLYLVLTKKKLIAAKGLSQGVVLGILLICIALIFPLIIVLSPVYGTNLFLAAITGIILGPLCLIIAATIIKYLDKKKREEMRQLSVEEILKNYEIKYEIPYSDIKKIEIKEERRVPSLLISTSKRTLKFMLQTKTAEAENLLRSTLPDKL